MLAKSLATAAIALAIAGILPASQAQAKTDVSISIGIGINGGYYGPGPGFGGWNDNDPGISCVAAKRIVYNRGFNKVQSIDCSGSNYKFTAWRNFRQFVIRVNDEGAITRIRPL